jgi:farnesyl-diphosphate farnesyltransferase
MLTLLLTHPDDFRTLIQFWLYHEQKRDITAQQEHPTSGWDRESMRQCWKFLDMTSRSFSAVIKELDGDLARTVSGLVVSMLYHSGLWLEGRVIVGRR